MVERTCSSRKFLDCLTVPANAARAAYNGPTSASSPSENLAPLRSSLSEQPFTFRCNAGPDWGRIACPTGKSKRRRSIAVRSRVSETRCPAFPVRRAPPRAYQVIHSADAPPRDRFLLARSSAARRSSRAGPRGAKRPTGWMDVAAWPGPEHNADNIAHPAGALSRKDLCARPGFLLRVRTARLSIRMARRPVE